MKIDMTQIKGVTMSPDFVIKAICAVAGAVSFYYSIQNKIDDKFNEMKMDIVHIIANAKTESLVIDNRLTVLEASQRDNKDIDKRVSIIEATMAEPIPKIKRKR